MVRDHVIDQVGPWEEIRKEKSEGEVFEFRRSLLLPPTVNAHTHLDLTTIGSQPYSGNFIEWVGMVMRQRVTDPYMIDDAVQKGWHENVRIGGGLIGDIAGNEFAMMSLRAPASDFELPGWGITFGELVGINVDSSMPRRVAEYELISRLRRSKVDSGLQPHAPYSTNLSLYHAAVDAASKLQEDLTRQVDERDPKKPRLLNPTLLSTHLAETHEEAQFVHDAAGPFVDLLKKLNKWDGSFKPTGLSPVQYLEPVLKRAKWLVAHCNYVSDDDIAILSKYGVSVAYCPIASDYFRHKNHRYRDMIDAGVNVCLGTDSIICQPAWSTKTLGIIAQVRFLYERDHTDPNLLLAMATTHGSKALGYVAAGPVSVHGVGALGTLAHGAPAVFTHYDFNLEDPTDPWIQLLRDRDYQGAVFEC